MPYFVYFSTIQPISINYFVIFG